MASNEPPNPPAGPSQPSLTSDSPPRYVPQFSAATEMILKRINSGVPSSLSLSGLSGTPPGFEDMRRNVLSSMKTSHNMEIPTTPIGNNRGRTARANANAGGSASASRTSATPTGSNTGGTSAKGKAAAKPKGRAGAKRKRAKEEEETTEEESDSNMSKLGGDSDSEESEVETQLPKITQSGRQVNKPTQFVPEAYGTSTKRRAPSKRSQEQALCKRCGRGHSPQNNMIVFCDGCNLGWHQMCHDPSISDEAVKDEKAPWYCADCSRKKGVKSGYETVRAVSWQGKSADEKRAYLSSLPQQQLVSLLLQATVLHPNLPIFPPVSNTHPPHAFIPVIPPARQSPAYQGRTNIHPQQPFPPSATSTAGLFTRAEANPTAPINFIRKIQPGKSNSPTVATPPPGYTNFPNSQTNFIHASAPAASAGQAGDAESRESTPASPPYPKAGTGMMSKLGPDEDDLDWLVDHNDFEAFNHIVYNDHGEKVEENGMRVNGQH